MGHRHWQGNNQFCVFQINLSDQVAFCYLPLFNPPSANSELATFKDFCYFSLILRRPYFVLFRKQLPHGPSDGFNNFTVHKAFLV